MIKYLESMTYEPNEIFEHRIDLGILGIYDME